MASSSSKKKATECPSVTDRRYLSSRSNTRGRGAASSAGRRAACSNPGALQSQQRPRGQLRHAIDDMDVHSQSKAQEYLSSRSRTRDYARDNRAK
jgi:hypothetical protein